MQLATLSCITPQFLNRMLREGPLPCRAEFSSMQPCCQSSNLMLGSQDACMQLTMQARCLRQHHCWSQRSAQPAVGGS